MITIIDVAREAGVSTATVSRVFNHSSQVMPGTRQKVMDAARRLGYEISPKKKEAPSEPARLILTLTSTTLPALYNSLARAASACGCQMLFNLYEPQNTCHILECLSANDICGIIFCSAFPPDSRLKSAMAGYPVVELCSSVLPPKHPYRVIANEQQMSFDAVSYLLETGCQSIAMISTDSTIPEHVRNQRQEGYIQALKSAGKPPLIVCGDYTYDGGHHAARQLLASGAACDGIFCICDMMAVGCLNYLHSIKKRIPEDISVISLDNMECSEFTVPPLTTVDAGIGESAAEAVRMLMDIAGRRQTRSKTVYIGHQLIIRQSTKPRPDF